MASITSYDAYGLFAEVVVPYIPLQIDYMAIAGAFS